MSSTNTAIIKQPLKVIEIPLNKFINEVIPHHQKIYEQHKAVVLKLMSLNNLAQMDKEINDKKRMVKQLKDLTYELDTLRTQVADCDLDQFDTKTLTLRKIILSLINGYTDLQKRASKLIELHQQELDFDNLNKENYNPFEGVTQIQIKGNLNDIKIKERQATLNQVEEINKNVEDLHEIYVQINEMVSDQREDVEHVEESVESTKNNVNSGLKQLVKASKLKTAAYPVTGAVIGTIIGGPIGLIAGLKVGGLAALGCAIAGYTGGKIFKKVNEADEVASAENTQNDNIANEGQQEKKDI